MRLFLYLSLLFFGLCGCLKENKVSDKQELSNNTSLHFSIQYLGDNKKIVSVSRPFVGGELTEKYLLYPRGTIVRSMEGITHYVETPVQKIAVNSTTYLGYIEAIEESDKIMAATNTSLFYSDAFTRQIKEGKVSSIGEQSINHEKLIQTQCDLLFTFIIDGSGLKEVERLRSLGQNVILVAEFMEQNPLDKSNWLKFFAAFFNKEDLADSILTNIEREYSIIKNEASQVINRPKVMVGLPWKGSWFVSGGDSFQANYFQAANSDYVWKNKSQEGGIPLTFESVLIDAIDSDIWINPGIVNSKRELLEKDKRFESFKPFKTDSIYTNYKRSKPSGANDYWESGVVRADLVLKDLVSIFHPELYPEYDLTYYKKLDSE